MVASNMRRSFLKLKDSELVRINAEANNARRKLDRHFKQRVVEVGEAQEVSQIIEVGLVARAVGRLRALCGGEGSHNAFIGTSIRPNPKDVDAAFGESLRERRGV